MVRCFTPMDLCFSAEDSLPNSGFMVSFSLAARRIPAGNRPKGKSERKEAVHGLSNFSVLKIVIFTLPRIFAKRFLV